MIYLVLAGFLVFSVFGVHQNKAPDKARLAQKVVIKQKISVAKKANVSTRPKAIMPAMLDGIELKDLSGSRHA